MLARLPVHRHPRTVLRADAVFDLAAAAVLLLAPAPDLYRLFELPEDWPALVARLLAIPMFAFAAFLWLGSTREGLQAPVALTAALANGLTIPVILLWILTGGSEMGPAGLVTLISLALLLAIFSSLEFDIVRRKAGPPTPAPDRH
jgi:peptidoglycan/LPS O-acetylase OafA/YrhL